MDTSPLKIVTRCVLSFDSSTQDSDAIMWLIYDENVCLCSRSQAKSVRHFSPLCCYCLLFSDEAFFDSKVAL